MTIQSNSLNSLVNVSGITNTGNSADTESVKHTTPASSIELMRKEKYELSISEEALLKALERANKALAGTPSQAQFSVHKPHGDIVVKLVDVDTKEVIREYPSEKVLNLLDKLEELNGKIIDEKR